MDQVPHFHVTWPSSAPLPRGMKSAALSALWAAYEFVMDGRFVLGALLGWKVLAVRRGGNEPTVKECAPLEAELADAQEQLAEARAAARQADRQLQEARDSGKQAEFTVLTLDAESERLEGEVAALREQLRAAVSETNQMTRSLASENGRLVRQNETALQQLHELAAALGQQRQQQQQQNEWRREETQEVATRQSHQEAKAAALDEEAQQQEEVPRGHATETDQLRKELDAVHAQLAAALRENAELEERLLQVAFESLSPTSKTHAVATFSPPRGGIPMSKDEEIQRILSASNSVPKDLFGAQQLQHQPLQQQQSVADAVAAAALGAAQGRQAGVGRPRSGGMLSGALSRSNAAREQTPAAAPASSKSRKQR